MCMQQKRGEGGGGGGVLQGLNPEGHTPCGGRFAQPASAGSLQELC